MTPYARRASHIAIRLVAIASLLCATSAGVAAQSPSATTAGRSVPDRARDATMAERLESEAVELEEESRDTEAERLYRSALEIWEDVRGPENPRVAACLSRLASNLSRQSRYDEAEPLFRRALEIKERVYGAASESLLAPLNNVAGLYVRRGAYGPALPLYMRALTIAEDTLGADHPTVGICLNNLAVLYLCQARLSEADYMHKRAASIAASSTGEDARVLTAALARYSTMRAAARSSSLRPDPGVAPRGVAAVEPRWPAEAPPQASVRTVLPRRVARVSDATMDELAGPVHTVRVEVERVAASGSARAGLARAPGPLSVYATDGSLRSRTYYRPMGGVDATETFGGDEAAGVVARVEGGLEATDVDEDDLLSVFRTLTYDASGYRTEERIAGEDGEEIARWVYSYDGAGNLTGRARLERGAPRYKEVLVYGDRGQVTELHEYGNGTSVTRKRAFSYELDGRGNWIKRVETDVTSPAAASRGPVLVTRRTITYY